MLHDAIYYGSFALLFGAGCSIAEAWRPARPIDFRRVLRRDLVAFAAYILVFFPLAGQLSRRLPFHYLPPTGFYALPLAVRVLAYYLAADLLSYGFHRLMHTRSLWRAHRWHHSPKYMYWFAGVRATLPQQFLFNLPLVFTAPLLFNSPLWVFQAIALETMLRNDWMHLNVSWKSSWLELVFVTPRFHHIHHAEDAGLRGSNFGSLFTFWDRLFGTFRDPDRLEAPLRFGNGEEVHPIRLIAGI